MAVTLMPRTPQSDGWITRHAPTLVSAGALVGLYYPSSAGGSISPALWMALSLLLAAWLITLLMRRGGALSQGAVINGIAINAVIWYFTLFSPFKEYALGNAPIYLCIGLMLMLNVRSIPSGRVARRTLTSMNIVNLALALLLVLSVEPAVQMVKTWYAAFYPELVPFMLELHKPVLTFATHSIAGFYFFIFFWINFTDYTRRQNGSALLFAIGYLTLSVFLLSNTAFVFFVVGIAEMSLYFLRNRPGVFIAAAIAVTTTAGCLLFINTATAEPFWAVVNAVLSFQGSGLSGRYTSSGDLAANFIYLRNNPISPIGMTFSPQLFYGDSGILTHFLRGSLFLPATIYGGLWFFLRDNCRSKRTFHRLFVYYLLFEIGFSNLEYLRTIALLPFFIVYLNGLEATDSAAHRNALQMDWSSEPV